MVFEDALDRLQEVRTQREGTLQTGLTVPEELGQGFVPHAVCQGCHGAGEQQNTPGQSFQNQLNESE